MPEPTFATGRLQPDVAHFVLRAVRGVLCIEMRNLKRRDQHYRSGKNPSWVKVKTATWRLANRE